MNYVKFMRALVELTENYKNVLFHKNVAVDIKNIVIGSGFEDAFIRELSRKLSILTELGPSVIQHAAFECLKGTQGLYSMHLDAKNYNLRFLYSYSDNGNIMLHLFEERAGKRKTSYEGHIPIALERRLEMEDALK